MLRDKNTLLTVMMLRLRRSAAVLLTVAACVASASASTAPANPDRLLQRIREVFRSHRPPPPYITYTLDRASLTEQGYPDYTATYSYHIWCRTSDRAALGRKVFRDDARGDLEFLRPEFNQDRDPGPPTADVFERAPAHPQPVEIAPTPEPAALPAIIGSVTAYGELEYHVTSVTTEGSLLHLSLVPIRDPDRNRLREIYVNKKTLELTKLIATDKLFIGNAEIHPVRFTINMTMLDGRPLVSTIHAETTDNYKGDSYITDYTFKDIKFPSSLPDWYFNARTYAMHTGEAPL